jgi:hypothetical protein
MDYKGYKLLDKIMLVCRDLPSRNGYGINCWATEYQAYFVDPSSKSQLESARNWAEWTESSGSHKNEEGKWVRDWEIEHKPVEFEFDNNGFTLELLDCAGGSSQGGKLSFWNCLVKKDGKTFKIGINSEMLLELLKDADFNKGVCQSPLIFITQKGRVGLTVKDSETYKQCISDRNLKTKFSSETTSKFAFGDLLKTATLKEVYLGTLTRYYTVDIGRNADRYGFYGSRYGIPDLRECTVIKLAKPITYHVFESLYSDDKKLSEFIEGYKKYQYSYPDLKKSCPKRVIDGKIDLDITEEDFYNEVIDKAYNFELYKKLYSDSYVSYGRPPAIDEDVVLFYFLGSRIFGFGKEPFELPEDIMNRLKAAGVKYAEEN